MGDSASHGDAARDGGSGVGIGVREGLGVGDLDEGYGGAHPHARAAGRAAQVSNNEGQWDCCGALSTLGGAVQTRADPGASRSARCKDAVVALRHTLERVGVQ